MKEMRAHEIGERAAGDPDRSLYRAVPELEKV